MTGAKFVPCARFIGFAPLLKGVWSIFLQEKGRKTNKMRCQVLFFERYVAQ